MQKGSNSGFSLIELVIVMLIVGILTSIALPAYSKYVMRSRRAAAEACLANYASYMERFYATYMSYKQTPAPANVSVRPLPLLDCAISANTGQYYSYDVDTTTLTDTFYSLTAAPKDGTAQKKNDTTCGTLILGQTGMRSQSATTDATVCWPH